MLALYFDHNAPLPIALGLRQRRTDVLTALEDGRDRTPDESLLRRAHELDRLLVSGDKDFPSITNRWPALGEHFSGLARIPRQSHLYRQLIDDLELIARAHDPADVIDQRFFLPLEGPPHLRRLPYNARHGRGRGSAPRLSQGAAR